MVITVKKRLKGGKKRERDGVGGNEKKAKRKSVLKAGTDMYRVREYYRLD